MCDQSERANWSPSILFAAGFPARIYRSPAVAKGSTAIDRVFGLSMPGSFASFCRASSSWKTSQRSLFGDWIAYSDRWPDSGILLVGACFPLKTWERPTFDGGFSSSPGEAWQTIVADDSINRAAGKINSRGEPKLSAEVLAWPTPIAAGFNDGETPGSWDARKQRNQTKAEGRTWAGALLAVEVKRWPAPSATDYKGSSRPGQRRRRLSEIETWPTPRACWAMDQRITPKLAQRDKSNIEEAVAQNAGLIPTTADLRLNPEWVEALMGFPHGWTTLGPPEEGQNSTPANRQEPESAGPEIGND